MRALYHTFFICPECRESFMLQVPLTKCFWSPKKLREAQYSYELDVVLHKARHVNDMVEKFIGGYSGKISSDY